MILLLFIYLFFFSPRMLFFARLWRWVLSAPGERREPGWGRDLGLEQGPDPCLPLGAGHPERSRSGAAPLLPAAAAVPQKVTSEPLCLCGVGSPTPAPAGMLPPLPLTPRGGAESFSRARIPRHPRKTAGFGVREQGPGPAPPEGWGLFQPGSDRSPGARRQGLK